MYFLASPAIGRPAFTSRPLMAIAEQLQACEILSPACAKTPGAAVPAGPYANSLSPWCDRAARHLPPDETGDMMEPNSAARERLLPDQDGTDDYSGKDESGSTQASDCRGETDSEISSSQGRQHGGGTENIIESVLMRERGQEESSSPPGSHGGGGGGTAGDIEMRGGSGGVYLV